MSDVPGKGFVSAIKGKVIVALLLACFALFLAWSVSRDAFKEMLNTVENIAAPSEKLRMVNVISRKISSLDQLQKKQAFNNPGNYRKLFAESRQLRLVLDTLVGVYAKDSLQLSRIAALKRLLSERDQQFLNYLKVRERLVNNKTFSEQVKNLNSLLSKTNGKSDSTILATEEKTSTTTIYPGEKPRSFLGKLFGRKKEGSEAAVKIVNESSVKRDTIALSAEARMAANLERSLQQIEIAQRAKNAIFLNREALLANSNSLIISQMRYVLRQVEREVVEQIEVNSAQAKSVVSTSIRTISLIMLVFVVLTGLLLYLIMVDITRSGRYRKELERAKDEAIYHGMAKQRFLSNMSHEIRTPLQSIIGYAEMIRYQSNPSLKDVEAIYSSSEHLLQIVNEVLDYNRIISGKFTFTDQAFNMKALLEEVIGVMRPQASLKSVDMNADFDLDGIANVNGDPFRLKQVLYNLLGNAIKFTHQGEITLTAFYKRQGDHLHFTFGVKDTGIGMSEEAAALIFNEFEQIHTPGNEALNRTGTGLGLSIVKSLVEHQGGRLYVKSKMGEGSVFTVYLTFTTANEDSAAATSQVLKGAGILKNNKVWVIDDDQLILDLCALIFRKHELNYRIFNSPLAMLHADWDDEVKYILLDMRMPEMDGFTLCRYLRERLGGRVKIYAITAQVLPDEQAHLLENGFDGLIRKPFREADLLAALHNELLPAMEDHAIVDESEIPDFSILRKMTFGDEEQLNKILLRFNKDSEDDSTEIRTALVHGDLISLRLLVHRLAGRTGQIGSRGLSAGFRNCELRLRAAKVLDDQLKKELLNLLNRLDQLMLYSIS